VNADEEAFRWFKLALVHPEYLGHGFQVSTVLNDERQLRGEEGVRPSELAAVYLRELWTSSLHRTAELLDTTADELVLSTPFHVVIGVPANWSPDTLFRLREAVNSAGIPGPCWRPQSTVEFLSEPEAATLAILQAPLLVRAGLNVRIIPSFPSPRAPRFSHIISRL
jgi:hypothetical protein